MYELPFSHCLYLLLIGIKDDYGALEPAISGKIMELHHKNHHQTYVNSFNAATEQLQAAESKQDIAAQIALQPLINFHGGGHVNHTLFWENLAPSKNGGGGEPAGKLKVCFDEPTFPLFELEANVNNPRSQQSKPPTAPSPTSRPNLTPRSPVSRAAVGHGLSRTLRQDKSRSAHMPTRTLL